MSFRENNNCVLSTTREIVQNCSNTSWDFSTCVGHAKITKINIIRTYLFAVEDAAAISNFLRQTPIVRNFSALPTHLVEILIHYNL